MEKVLIPNLNFQKGNACLSVSVLLIYFLVKLLTLYQTQKRATKLI